MRLPRAGVTLIEVLVVIAISSVLLSLIVAAVFRARAAGLRVTCQNNLRQIGLAATHYMDAMGSFPPGTRNAGGKAPFFMMGWLPSLLPYLEKESLWNRIPPAYSESQSPFRNPPHVGIATVVPGFACPADSRVAAVVFAPRDKLDVALTSYLGVEGLDLFKQDGVLFLDSRIRLVDIRDGASQTLLAGERPPSADFQFGWWYAGSGQEYTGSVDTILGVEEQNILPSEWAPCKPGKYTFGPGQVSNQCDLFHFWSLHSGGANFLFVDGSVHFLSYSGAAILPALATRAGGDFVPDIDG